MRQHKLSEMLMMYYQVALRRSFRQAAEHLQVSPGFLSQQIKVLERALDCQLLIRNTRKVVLTPAGEQVYQSAQLMTAQINSLKHGLESEQGFPSGPIRVTAPKAFAQRFLLPVIEQMQQRYPRIRFELDVAYEQRDLGMGDFDLAFRATNNPPDATVARQLFSYAQWYAAAPDYIDRHGTPLDPQELVHHECLCHPHFKRWDFIDASGQLLEVNVEGRVLIADNDLMLQQALKGHGLIRQAEYVLQPHIEAKRLVRLFPEYSGIRRHIWMLCLPVKQRTSRVDLFMHAVLDSLKSA